MILICYDGSDDAKAAIQHGGELLNGPSATVLTVWQPVAYMGARAPSAFMFLPSLIDAEEIDKVNEEFALERANEGCELARQAGFVAEAASHARTSTTAEAILAEADRLDAGAILLGSRGLTGLKSLLLGSVSHAVLQHAGRPVIVVPSPTVARSRTKVRRAVNEKTNSKAEG